MNSSIMKIVQHHGKPEFHKIINLVNTIWPTEFGNKSDEEKIESMFNSYNSKTDTMKYLYKDDLTIGFYRYSLWPRTADNPDSAHTYDIAILPEFQKKGLGTKLMNDMIEDCKQKGLKKLISRTFKTNRGSISFHESLNFTKQLETEDSIVWEKNL